MPTKTVTRADLVEALAKRANMPRGEASRLLTQLLDHIENALVAGETVKLSRFGNFTVRAKRQRVGRNPKTGDRVDVPAKKIPFFKPSKELKDLVNTGAPAGSSAAPAPAATPAQ